MPAVSLWRCDDSSLIHGFLTFEMKLQTCTPKSQLRIDIKYGNQSVIVCSISQFIFIRSISAGQVYYDIENGQA